MATLAERLLAGEHAGCASWADVARRFGCNEKTLRVVRKALEARGTPAQLIARGVGSEFTAESDSHHAMGGGQPDTKWPSVEAFDRDDFRNPEMLPYEPPATPMVRKLTREECPDSTLILWASDIHIPIHNEEACRLMVECAEKAGATRAIAGGDILDFNCLSQHDKEAYRVVEHATLLDEVQPGRWLLDWFATKETDYILGNHEGRLNRFIDRNPAFHGSVLSNFAQLVDLPRNISIVPQGGEVRLGNFSARHLDAEFKKSSGGKYPAQRLLEMLPDQSTMGGHVHRMSTACRTTRDEDGIARTRRAWTMGHMSNEADHLGYVSTSPNWQTGFGFIRVYWLDNRPRWTVTQVEVLFDRRNRPYFEHEGRVYGAVQVAA